MYIPVGVLILAAVLLLFYLLSPPVPSGDGYYDDGPEPAPPTPWTEWLPALYGLTFLGLMFLVVWLVGPEPLWEPLTPPR